MENNYGIAVKNKFSLFLDDDCDPFEILRSTEEEKLKTKTDKSKKDAKNEAKAAKSVKNKAAKKPATPIQDQAMTVDVNANKKEGFSGEQKPRGGRGRGGQMDGDRGGNAVRGNREGGFGNREFDRPPRRERMDRERGEGRGDRPPMEFRDRAESGRGRGRGERGGRGRGRGSRGGGFGAKREFERHSGSDKTGIKPMEKREGGGAHNWGTMKDDMEGEQLNESVENETVEAPEGNENQNPNAEPTEDDTHTEEEERKEMTLDEWKAQQNQARAASTFNIRKPGEGVNNEQWKKTYLLKKKVEKTESDDDDSEEEEEDTRQKKNLLNIEITFNDQPTRGRGGRRGRGGGDRGGRGRGDDRGGRGGRGRGGDRGERGDRGDRAPGDRGGGFGAPRGGGRGGDRGGGEDRGDRGDRGGSRREAAPHIEDENDFPSLGGK